MIDLRVYNEYLYSFELKKGELMKKLLICAIAIIILSVATKTAKAHTITYQLNDVYLGSASREMTGTFEWTYNSGDFENGSGLFTDLYIPWYGSEISDFNITIEPKSIEFTLAGNFHDQGVDITLFFLDGDGLSSTNMSSVIDTSRSEYKIEVGVTYSGFVVNGSVDAMTSSVPEPTTIALLGIGLAGLAGAEVRRRRKKRAVDKS